MPEPRGVHPRGDVSHLLHRVEVAEVVPPAKLVQVSMRVLGAEALKRPLARPLEHRPLAALVCLLLPWGTFSRPPAIPECTTPGHLYT